MVFMEGTGNYGRMGVWKLKDTTILHFTQPLVEGVKHSQAYSDLLGKFPDMALKKIYSGGMVATA